jgi:hypothetical protein
MRFVKPSHFRIEDIEICLCCKTKPVKPHLVLCNECKDKHNDSDIDFYVPEIIPSEVKIECNKLKTRKIK